MIRLKEIVVTPINPIAPEIIEYFYGFNASKENWINIPHGTFHSQFIKQVSKEKISFKLTNIKDWLASIQMLINMDIEGLTIDKDNKEITFDNSFNMDVMKRRITPKDYQYTNFTSYKYSTVGKLLEEIIFAYF